MYRHGHASQWQFLLQVSSVSSTTTYLAQLTELQASHQRPEAPTSQLQPLTNPKMYLVGGLTGVFCAHVWLMCSFGELVAAAHVFRAISRYRGDAHASHLRDLWSSTLLTHRPPELVACPHEPHSFNPTRSATPFSKDLSNDSIQRTLQIKQLSPNRKP